MELTAGGDRPRRQIQDCSIMTKIQALDKLDEITKQLSSAQLSLEEMNSRAEQWGITDWPIVKLRALAALLENSIKFSNALIQARILLLRTIYPDGE